MYLYLHVPFCLSRCVYCDFYVVLEKYGGHAAYVQALRSEIQRRLSQFPTTLIQTLYVGGGTPSLLTANDYRQIFETVRQYAEFAPGAEITLEANPEALKDSPERYLEVGFNRLSVGIQSLNNVELKRLSRIHTAEMAEIFIKNTQKAGFANISVDLMYGIPGQSRSSWQETLDRVVALGVQHVSMYGLKVEPNTPLNRLVAFEAYGLPQEEETVEMYFQALQFLEISGFRRYEFSNLAQPGYESHHNLNYWNNGDYHAFGVSAHGYVNGQRYETVRDLTAYLENPLAGEVYLEPLQERLENALIFGLRKSEGVDIAAIESEFQIDFRQQYQQRLAKYLDEGYLLLENGILRLSPQAIPVSNTILSEFLD